MRRTVPGKKKHNYDYVKEAYKSFKKNNYANAAIILEKASGAGIEDSYAIFLLALSYLYNGEFSRAEIALNRLEKSDPDYPPYIQLRSFLALKSSASSEEAISFYISSLEKLPLDKTLKKSISKIENSNDFYKLQKDAKISSFVKIPSLARRNQRGFSSGITSRYKVPGRGFKKHLFPSRALTGFLLIAVLCLTAGVSYYYSDRIFSFFPGSRVAGKKIPGLEKIDMVNLSGTGYGLINKVSKEASPEFYISGDQLQSDFNNARNLIKKSEFNRAIVILNRIMNSNSSFMVKEKVEFLIRFIIESDEKEYEKFTYDDIMVKPYLYRGASLVVSGQAANVKESAKGTSFSLLVDFDGKNFKGAIDAFSKSALEVKDGDNISIKGVFYPDIGQNKRPFITVDMLSGK